MRKINICNAEIDDVSMREALRIIKDSIKEREEGYVLTPNVDHLMMLQKDEEFRHIYQGASLVCADGMPLLWGARFLGTPLKEKVSGSDLFVRLCKIAAEKGYGLFFLGGRPGSALKAADMLSSAYKNIRITGVYSPPFGFEDDHCENEKILAMIRKAQPDILFVGLGAPKQEKWIYRHYRELKVPVSIGIGATFEFTAGVVKRAPLWMQKSGLEWLWRLAMEPGRLWKRYLIRDVKFFWLLLKQKIGKHSQYEDHMSE